MDVKTASVDQNCLIDLHLHLDGSISIPSARRLAELGGIPVPEDDAKLRRLLSVDEECRDLNEYLACFDFPLSLLQSAQQLTECARILQQELADAGFIYAELRFSPQSHGRLGLTQRGAIEAVLDGIQPDVLPVGIICCCMRGADNRDANLETVRLAAEYLGRGVVVVDLAGAEALFPTEDFADVFALARELGVPFTIHAGEAAGPESVRTAIAFGARRLGHGVRAAEDPALLTELHRLGVTLEVCPTSEINTCVHRGYTDFPMRQLRDAGVRMAVCSDNMAVSSTDVRRELRKLAKTFALTDADIRELLEDAARAAFAPDDVKEQLLLRIAAEFER